MTKYIFLVPAVVAALFFITVAMYRHEVFVRTMHRDISRSATPSPVRVPHPVVVVPPPPVHPYDQAIEQSGMQAFAIGPKPTPPPTSGKTIRSLVVSWHTPSQVFEAPPGRCIHFWEASRNHGRYLAVVARNNHLNEIWKHISGGTTTPRFRYYEISAWEYGKGGHWVFLQERAAGQCQQHSLAPIGDNPWPSGLSTATAKGWKPYTRRASPPLRSDAASPPQVITLTISTRQWSHPVRSMPGHCIQTQTRKAYYGAYLEVQVRSRRNPRWRYIRRGNQRMKFSLLPGEQYSLRFRSQHPDGRAVQIQHLPTRECRQ